MMSASKVILLLTIFLAIARIQARNFPDDGIQTINGETSFPDTSKASFAAAKSNLAQRSLLFIMQENLSNLFVAISNFIRPGIQYDKYSKSTNFSRPSGPAPAAPRAPPGPRPASNLEMPVRKSPGIQDDKYSKSTNFGRPSGPAPTPPRAPSGPRPVSDLEMLVRKSPSNSMSKSYSFSA